jgi:hypothetical protein
VHSVHHMRSTFRATSGLPDIAGCCIVDLVPAPVLSEAEGSDRLPGTRFLTVFPPVARKRGNP